MTSISRILCFVVILDSTFSFNVTDDSLDSSEEISDESSGSISIEVENKRLKSLFDMVNLQYGYYGLAERLHNKTERLLRKMDGAQRLELLNNKLSELWAKVKSEPLVILGMEAGLIGRVVMNLTKHKVDNYRFKKTFLKNSLFYDDNEIGGITKLFERFKENVKNLDCYFQPPERDTSHK